MKRITCSQGIAIGDVLNSALTQNLRRSQNRMPQPLYSGYSFAAEYCTEAVLKAVWGRCMAVYSLLVGRDQSDERGVYRAEIRRRQHRIVVL